MNNFHNWVFLLDGDVQQFRELSERSYGSYFNIFGGVSEQHDCRNEDFRMTTLYCENETDAETVWQIGHELVSLFNGASILYNQNYYKASIYALNHNNHDIPYQAIGGNLGLMGKPEFSQERIDEEFINAGRTSRKIQLIHLATENRDVYCILKYFDMQQGWGTYYKLLEAIEYFAKEKQITLNIDDAKRRAFTNTANNFSLSGFDSRHGFKDITRQNRTPAMKVNEGYDFISSIAKRYLQMTYFTSNT